LQSNAVQGSSVGDFDDAISSSEQSRVAHAALHWVQFSNLLYWLF
jgi:hypothetical protein